MSRLAVLAALSLLAACKSPPPTQPAPEPDPAAAAAVVKLEELQARACACTDVACTGAVAVERATFFESQHGLYVLTAAQRTAADAANAGYRTCAARQPETTESDRALAEFRALTDRMCACKDKACAEAVVEELGPMGERYKDTKVDESAMKEAAALTERLTQCMTKALDATP